MPWIAAAIALAAVATWTGVTLARRGEPAAPGIALAAVDAALTSSRVSRDVLTAAPAPAAATPTAADPPPAASPPPPRVILQPRAVIRLVPTAKPEVARPPAPPVDDIPAFR
jgi:hypothetical protein